MLIGITVGCSEPLPDGTIRVGLANSPTNLDPRYATDATSSHINRLLYSRLVDFDDRSMPIPASAKWLKISPTHYRFELLDPRPVFHDGVSLTSHDVKATYESILDSGTVSPHRGILLGIRRIDTPSDSTVDFFLKQPDSLFPSYLVIGILPANLIAQAYPFHDHPIGSGPFQFRQRPDDTRLILERREDGQLVEFLRVPDPTVRTLKLLAGEIHILQNDLPSELVTYLATQSSIKLQQRRGSNFAYLGFNHLDPIVGREKIRKAIAHAIDRVHIIQSILGGRARPAQAIFPPDHWAGYPGLSGYPYDPDHARQLLREAGFTEDQRPHVRYKTSTDPFRLRLATIIQYQLRQVGIDVSIDSHDWGTFYGDIKAGRFQMYSLAWVGVNTPDIFRYVFHSKGIPPMGANRGRFSSILADELILQAEQATDRKRQQVLYHRLQAHLLDTLPYVPLWFEDHFAVTTPFIQNYRLQPRGNYDGLLHVQLTSSQSPSVSQVAHQFD